MSGRTEGGITPTVSASPLGSASASASSKSSGTNPTSSVASAVGRSSETSPSTGSSAASSAGPPAVSISSGNTGSTAVGSASTTAGASAIGSTATSAALASTVSGACSSAVLSGPKVKTFLMKLNAMRIPSGQAAEAAVSCMSRCLPLWPMISTLTSARGVSPGAATSVKFSVCANPLFSTSSHCRVPTIPSRWD